VTDTLSTIKLELISATFCSSKRRLYALLPFLALHFLFVAIIDFLYFDLRPDQHQIHTFKGGGLHIFQKTKSHLIVLGSRTVARSAFHAEETQKLGVTVKYAIATAKWRLRSLYSLL